MRNFQGIVFTGTQTCREIFKICISVPLMYETVMETLPRNELILINEGG